MSALGNNIAAYLPQMAAHQPETPALHLPQTGARNRPRRYRSYSYANLEQRSNTIARTLSEIGIRRGMHTVLMVKPGFDFFALTFALFKTGAVPVLIDPGMGLKNLKACLHEAQPEAFIGQPSAQLARLVLGWGRETLRILLTVGPTGVGGTSLARLLREQSQDCSFHVVEPAADETAAILFTSGSTGVPKGAVYSHGNFIAQVEALKKLYGIEPGEIDVPTFPLFALFAPALGMTSVIPQMDFTRPGQVDPEEIISAIQDFAATTMFGSPALIRRVGDYGAGRGYRLPSLRRVISAGAPVGAPVLETFCRLLEPGVEVHTPYGATEALPVSSIGSREILADTRSATDQGQGVCVGRPVTGLELEIIRISDQPLSSWTEQLRVVDGEIGEIAVRGAQVTGSYYNRPEATALAKIGDSAGGFYHRMGDLGYRDVQGRIWFCGRKSHRVITAQQTLYTIPCEALFNVHELVSRTALVGVGEPGRQQPVLCVEPQRRLNRAERTRLCEDLGGIARNQPMTQEIQQFLIHPRFPVDIRHNAKIFRERLAVWAARRLS